MDTTGLYAYTVGGTTKFSLTASTGNLVSYGGYIATGNSGNYVALDGPNNSLSFTASGGNGHIVPFNDGSGFGGLILHYGATPDATGATGPAIWLSKDISGVKTVKIDSGGATVNGAYMLVQGNGTLTIQASSVSLVNNPLRTEINGTKTILGNQSATGNPVEFQTNSTVRGAISYDSTNTFLRLYSASGSNLRLDTSSTTDDVLIAPTGGTIYLGNVSSAGDSQNVYSRSIASHSITTGTPRPVYVQGASPYQVGYNAGSTVRIKQQISDYEWDAPTVLSLTPKRFKYNAAVDLEKENAAWSYGFIAEQAEELGLDWLIGHDSEGKVDYFAYEKLPVVLHSILRQQQSKINDLEARLKALEEKL